LLARFGKVSFPTPGGCVIGARPIDLFVKGYELMGASVSENSHVYIINSKKNLQASKIQFEKISVGATETLMMAAVLAHGTTILENCAMEPEIVNVAEWLNACGAKINGVGTRTITIEGSNGALLQSKTEYIAMPDRIEAGSFLFLGALCAEELIINNCDPDHLETVINLLKDSGVHIDSKKEEKKIIISKNTDEVSSFKAFDIVTKEYPGFPTDLQAPAVVFLTQVNGNSHVIEKIFEGRFKYVEDLVNMGAEIQTINPHEIKIHGPNKLNEIVGGKEFGAHDIRAGFAMILAALVAKGDFKINNVRLVDRGYEKIEQRLSALGANIKRVK
jgi:UDP-N-acetylglucosamine 1-carboxyvinyltransferase